MIGHEQTMNRQVDGHPSSVQLVSNSRFFYVTLIFGWKEKGKVKDPGASKENVKAVGKEKKKNEDDGSGGDPLELSGGKRKTVRALCLVMQSGRTQYNKLDPLPPSLFLSDFTNSIPFGLCIK